MRRAIDEQLLSGHHDALAVVDHDRIVGLVSRRSLGAAHHDRTSATTPVSSVMTRIDDIEGVDAHMRLDEVVDRMKDNAEAYVVVMDGLRLVGIITQRDIARWLQRHGNALPSTA